VKSHRPPPGDWRRQGQERYLSGVRLSLEQYRPFRPGWEHDHCEFCSAKFCQTDGSLHLGYTTEDHYRWICEECFRDFQDEFGWVLR